MAWLTANWFWVLIFIAFIAMHMFGHGGHATGDRPRGADRAEPDESPERGSDDRASGHRH